MLCSCTTQLCTVVHDFSKSIDQSLQNDVFILDFAKDFDHVPHERLSLPHKRQNTSMDQELPTSETLINE